MDLNLVVLAGRLAAPPETKNFESGATLTKYLVTVRSEDPKRVDVIPVTYHGEDAPEATPGDRVWVAGSLQRMFWDHLSEGRRSRIEVVADQVCIREGD